MYRLLVLVLLVACPSMGPLPPKRWERTTVAVPMEGVTVKTTPYSYTGWIITVDNRRDEAIAINWDASSLIAHDGFSQGRFVRGRTRGINDASAQPSSPIAPRSKLREIVFPEFLDDFKPRVGEVNIVTGKVVASEAKAAGVADLETECREQRTRCSEAQQPKGTCDRNFNSCMGSIGVASTAKSTKPAEKDGDAPAVLRTGVGRLVLVFDTARGRESWDAWVSFDGTKAPDAPKPEPPKAEPKPEQ